MTLELLAAVSKKNGQAGSASGVRFRTFSRPKCMWNNRHANLPDRSLGRSYFRGTFIFLRTEVTTSMSSHRVPPISMCPPVIAAATAQLPASM